MKCLETFSTKKWHSESREQMGFPCSDSNEKLSPSTSRGVVCPKKSFLKKKFFWYIFFGLKKMCTNIILKRRFSDKNELENHEKSRKWRFRSAGSAPIDLILQRNQLLMSTISRKLPGTIRTIFVAKIMIFWLSKRPITTPSTMESFTFGAKIHQKSRFSARKPV